MSQRIAFAALATTDIALLLTFTIRYSHHRSFAPLFVFLLPVIVGNFIYSRELISRVPDALINRRDIQFGNVQTALPLAFMTFFFCTGIVRLVRFDASLGWSAPVCLGLSLILSLGLIAAYGAVKSALKSKVQPPRSR
jgi:hypothetical protein